jgi:hypothetical protein
MGVPLNIQPRGLGDAWLALQFFAQRSQNIPDASIHLAERPLHLIGTQDERAKTMDLPK